MESALDDCHLVFACDTHTSCCNLLQRNSVGSSNPCDCFKFELEERLLCVQSGQVRYKKRSDYLLPLPIPLMAAVNKGTELSHGGCCQVQFGGSLALLDLNL